jgi:hypothetical protein
MDEWRVCVAKEREFGFVANEGISLHDIDEAHSWIGVSCR